MDDIRNFRDYLGMSRTEFGESLGVTQAAVYKYETCKAQPSPRTAWRLIWLARDWEYDLGWEEIYPEPKA